MNTEIKIGSKNLKIASNALTPILYRQIFGKDFLLLFSQIMTKNRGLIDKALGLRKSKAAFDAGEIDTEEYLNKINESAFTEEELSFINERADIMGELAFVMAKQAELEAVDKLLKLTINDYYIFLSEFDSNDLRAPEVIGTLTNFWQGNTTPIKEVEPKNA